MTAEDQYDYVQIVIDDDWGLFGIVPNNGSGDIMKKMATKTPDEKMQQLPPKPIVTKKIITPAAVQITQADIQPIEPITVKINPNSLSGFTVTDGNRVFATGYQNRIDLSLGNISSGKIIKENVLVGFGN